MPRGASRPMPMTPRINFCSRSPTLKGRRSTPTSPTRVRPSNMLLPQSPIPASGTHVYFSYDAEGRLIGQANDNAPRRFPISTRAGRGSHLQRRARQPHHHALQRIRPARPGHRPARQQRAEYTYDGNQNLIQVNGPLRRHLFLRLRRQRQPAHRNRSARQRHQLHLHLATWAPAKLHRSGRQHHRLRLRQQRQSA